MEDTAQSISILHSIPTGILVSEVLTRLQPQDLFRLAACSQHLLQAVSADDVWQPLCDSKGWGPFDPGQYMWEFAARQRVLCVECEKPTRYTFTLLGCRLCEACEHQSPRYALVTALEAEQRYGVSARALSTLRSVSSCHKQFYLRDAVLRLVADARTGAACSSHPMHNKRDSSLGSHAFHSEEDESAEEAEEEEEEEEGEHESPKHSSSRADSRGTVSRDEQRAARKAAKKQAKAEQRLKREAKAAGLHTPGNSSGTCQGSGRRGRAASRGQRLTKSSQQAAPRHAGLHQGLYPDEDTGTLLLGASPKAKSEWLAERESIMREYGQFAISGLLLA